MSHKIDEIRRYFETLRGTEHAKDKLIEELLEELNTLNQKYEQEQLDRERESHFNRDIQLRESRLKEELRLVATRTDRDAFILVLIDGDGMIFEDKLIQRGEAGGKEAAGILWGAVKDYVQLNVLGLSSDYKIVTRVYANVKGLGDVCKRAGIIESSTIMEDFMRGFTGSKQLFDFIDVGSGKDRADDKVSELFKLYLYNCHCRHIVFGCSHDNGYARLLEDVAGQTLSRQITLLEGVPFERELATLKSRYPTTRFESLFRTTKINLSQTPYQPPRPLSVSQPQSTSQMLPAQMHPLPHVQQNGFSNGTQHRSQELQHPQQSAYQSPYLPMMARTPSESTNNSMLNPAAESWAAKAVSAPPAHIASPLSAPQPLSSENANKIPRNKYGQRIDPVIQYDKSEFKRVQKIHMCNVHFLRNDCPYDNNYMSLVRPLATLAAAATM
ncbi:hypothetical protein MMC13_008073 [Lambiella insularis]|nr:hypothetical protein [Lambiella insularis]